MIGKKYSLILKNKKMKKIKFTLYLFIMFFFLGKGIAQVSSENIKAIPAIIQSENNKTESFKEYKAFKSSSLKSSKKEIREVVTKASILSIDENGLGKILSTKPDKIRLTIPNAHGDDYNVQLIKADIFTSDYTVKTNLGNKGIFEAPGIHYRGIITDNYESLVAMSLFENEIMGFISTNNEQLVLGRLGKSSKDHILYHEKNLTISSDFVCSTPADGASYSAQDLAPPQIQKTTEDDCVKIYVEIDNDIFLDKGTGTANYIAGLFNQSATIYANDGVTIIMSEMFIWGSASPYGGSCSGLVLESFQAFRTNFNGDLAHLVSYDSNLGGIAAGFNGLCNPDRSESMCFSGIESSFNSVPVYSWSVSVFTHEMGHLLGSRHTHACVWNGNNTAIDGCGSCQEEPNPPPSPGGCAGSGLDCNFCAAPPIPSGGGTIMSYCHQESVGINFNNGFGPQPTNVILNSIANANCLSCSVCLPDLTLNGTIPSLTYEAENVLTSTGTIGANECVIFHAGNHILLEDVFLADASNGSIFLAEIQGCSSGFSGGLVNSLTQEPTDVVYDYGNKQTETSKQKTTDLATPLAIKNYPNPFTGQTTVEFDLPEDAEVNLFVSDMTGKQIARLLDNKPRLKGTHQIVFDGRDYPAGIYYYTIQAGQYMATQKMTLIK